MDILSFSYRHSTFEKYLVSLQNDPLDCKKFEHCILDIDLHCIAIQNSLRTRFMSDIIKLTCAVHAANPQPPVRTESI